MVLQKLPLSFFGTPSRRSTSSFSGPFCRSNVSHPSSWSRMLSVTSSCRFKNAPRRDGTLPSPVLSRPSDARLSPRRRSDVAPPCLCGAPMSRFHLFAGVAIVSLRHSAQWPLLLRPPRYLTGPTCSRCVPCKGPCTCRKVARTAQFAKLGCDQHSKEPGSLKNVKFLYLHVYPLS